ncbi:hypothetical protein EVG20_g7257 [Dentipellis fragilis]|uniref:Uncharacterized protein n=1 Tax=Dentipellis fragilis TaxID=205917 RepID=A0A4Y9YHF6_9AGAM|nr:hypothetical protein EVG20_g7257 [Dentipellis fragilis]
MKPSTSYEGTVLSVLSRMTRQSEGVRQDVLRQCLGLSSSYLVTDTTMNPAGGAASWMVGFNRLVDVMFALHGRGELELETVNAASKACSECWSVTGNWTGLEECRETIRGVAERLKRLLDENGRTYEGAAVYVP